MLSETILLRRVVACQEGVGRIVTERGWGESSLTQFKLHAAWPRVNDRRLANLLDAAPARVDVAAND